MSDPDQ